MVERVAIIGAGMAGLAAATSLRQAGFHPVLLDKSRAVGGRMSSKTIDGARFDHGAQHFGLRTDEAAALLEPVRQAGVMREWFRTEDGRSRFVGAGGMRSIPEFLARDLEVHTGLLVERLEIAPGRVVVHAGERLIDAGAAVITPPLPQTLALLEASGISVSDPALSGVTYRACLAVMAHLEGPSGLPDGHLTVGENGIAWLADNAHKGTSPAPSVTIHSTPGFAADHLEADPSPWVGRLVEAAQIHLHNRVTAAVGHRWRYAEPTAVFDTGSLVLQTSPPLVLAGEVFAGAKVEGAALSGLSAARKVADLLA